MCQLDCEQAVGDSVPELVCASVDGCNHPKHVRWGGGGKQDEQRVCCIGLCYVNVNY
jgi:hypothetical protein